MLAGTGPNTSFPAAGGLLRIGDRVISWNGQPMVDPATGAQRLLKDVVVAAETHTLTIERALDPLAMAAATAIESSRPPKTPPAKSGSGEWKQEDSWGSDEWKGTDSSWSSDDSWGS